MQSSVCFILGLPLKVVEVDFSNWWRMLPGETHVLNEGRWIFIIVKSNSIHVHVKEKTKLTFVFEPEESIKLAMMESVTQNCARLP